MLFRKVNVEGLEDLCFSVRKHNGRSFKTATQFNFPRSRLSVGFVIIVQIRDQPNLFHLARQARRAQRQQKVPIRHSTHTAPQVMMNQNWQCVMQSELLSWLRQQVLF